MNIVVKISNKDIRKVTDDEMIFDSENQTLPVHKQQSFRIVIPDGQNGGTLDIPHNLGYKPIFRCWMDSEIGTGRRVLIPDTRSIPGDSGGVWNRFAFGYKDKIRITINNSAPGWTSTGDTPFNGYLYIFAKKL